MLSNFEQKCKLRRASAAASESMLLLLSPSVDSYSAHDCLHSSVGIKVKEAALTDASDQ